MAAAQYGEQQFSEISGKVSQYVDVGQMRFYFTVDTKYVGKKIQRLLLPFLPKTDWERQEKEGKARPPKDDVNAPDLYIPIMAFLTYVLAVGLELASSGRWAPENLGLILSSTTGWVVFEVLVCYGALWFMNVAGHPVLELLALCSYKFVGMVFGLLTYFLTGRFDFFLIVIGTVGVGTGFARAFNSLPPVRVGVGSDRR
eukprot:m.733971 g.733971  ORF g.733971 m.733971 type:complete len:200 (+) comp23077_c0_seq1:397-996(+)